MLKDQINRAIKEYNNGLYTEALTILLMSDYTEDDFIVNYYLGLIYIKLKDFDQGKENLELYIANDDNLLRIFQCRMLLAYASIEVNNFEEAQMNLDILLDSGYESAKLYALIGFIFYKQDKKSKSIKYYRKALEIDPENSNALNSLGYILSEYKEDLKEAETLCRRALSIDVDNPAYLDSLGWVCLKNRKVPASQSFFSRAQKLDPENRVINDHINELNNIRN